MFRILFCPNEQYIEVCLDFKFRKKIEVQRTKNWIIEVGKERVLAGSVPRIDTSIVNT